jgi:acetylglutamate kinase
MEQLKVVKIGGNVIDQEEVLKDFLQDFASLEGNKILVHGGGKLATKLSADLGIQAQMIDGRRITDEATLKIVTMVYAGWINKNIVAKLQYLGAKGVGFSGADANLILSKKRVAGEVDFGYVGDPVKVNTSFLKAVIEERTTPVIAPITHDGQGNLLNTNADTIASVIAVAMSEYFKVQLIYCFEKPGVLRDPENDDSVIPHIYSSELEHLKSEKIISGGMLPKIDNCFNAIQNGVQEVLICKADNLKYLNHKEKFVGTVLTS